MELINTGVGNATLNGLIKKFLHKSLDKGIDYSAWTSAELIPKQILYAALDAYASLTLAIKIKDIPDPYPRLTKDEILPATTHRPLPSESL
jgi:ribonuclease D